MSIRIGFDAKRAYNNSSGLGNYSRATIEIMARYYPENEYFLYSPKISDSVAYQPPVDSHLRMPDSVFDKTFDGFWRSFRITRQIKKDKLQIFHGLSHELPFPIRKAGCKTVVTIHDLIFKRYPLLYKFPDQLIYYNKFNQSCKIADKIIAISEQTKLDIVEFFSISASKIEVIYQSCNPVFLKTVDTSEKAFLRELYNLPEQFLLNVGSIERRKNQKVILEAMVNEKLDIPLVIVGRPTEYLNELQLFIEQHNLKSRVTFLHNVPTAHLPGLYQMAEIFIYPSIFEGFGLPILESLSSGTAVITTRYGCFPEAGGPSSLYSSPFSPEELASEIFNILTDSALKEKMQTEGRVYASGFAEEKVAANLYKLYQKLL